MKAPVASPGLRAEMLLVSPMVDPDRELFEAWRNGDPAAGETLIDRHAAEITWFFRNKVFQEGDVADLVSQTFLGCVAARDRFRAETSFRRFLYAIAQNVLRGYLRTKAKRRREEVDFTTVCVQSLDPRSISSIQMHRRELRAFVDALRRVPVDDQIVLELKYFEDLSGAEIGKLLDLPEGTVRGRLRRGLERLRAQVSEELSVGAPQPIAVSSTDLEDWAAHVRELRSGG